MKSRIYSLVLFVLLFSANSIEAQLSAPEVESVYGGRINAIAGYSYSGDSSRIFISTESANSIFYADVYTHAGLETFSPFTVMPGVNAAAGYGLGIQQIAAHEGSGHVLFIHQSGLLSSEPFSISVYSIYTGFVQTMALKGDYLFFLSGNQLHYGTLDASANFTAGSGSPLILPGMPGMVSMKVNPYNGRVYMFIEGNSPVIYMSSDHYTVFNSATTFTNISPATLSTSVFWKAFGIGYDGRLMTGGNDFTNKYFAYTDDAISWTEYYTGIGGVSGPNIDVAGDSASYSVYFASGYNTDKGNSGFWNGFGNPGGMETHPNDGSVFTDPSNNNIVYMTTDQGIGASVDGGATIFEIDEGVEAVWVRDFDMTASKNTAWLASKSGIRRVNNYLTSPTWTNAIFPMGDGSPYYSADMDPVDSTIVYVGNVRVYKTTDNGMNWNRVFTPEDPPYNFSGVGSQALAIEVCQFERNTVFAGFTVQDSAKGGLFYSTDAGNNWNQILLEASSIGEDVDVQDIAFNIESGDTVAYVGVEYDLTYPQGYSVYRIVKSGTLWTPSQDFGPLGTSTGSVIVATIRDVHVSVTGDTIFAAGTDAGINHPMAYYKPLNTTALWTPFTTAGFPFFAGKQAMAVTQGIDTIYVAVDNEVYYIEPGASTWTLGYSYSVGTRIDFLYYDELLVGTEYGLFAHFGTNGTTAVKNNSSLIPEDLELSQNYPNPFNPSTRISFSLPAEQKISLKVFDILGREIAELFNGIMPAGIHDAEFSASSLSSGIYFYVLNTENKTMTKKMMLLK